MLHQVAEFARRESLSAEPGFAPKYARWAIVCGTGGEYEGLVELGDAGSRTNQGRLFAKAPDLSQPEMKAGGITKSHFLIDTASAVVGHGKDAVPEKARYFVDLLDQASSAMPSLIAAATVLRTADSVARLRADFEEHKAKGTDKVTFLIEGEFPAESEAWHDWWRTFRRGLQAGKERDRRETATMLCLITGERVTPASTHPKITGLTSVGGLAMGDVLIGFKQESFRSYGLEQSANAAMSELAAKTYQSGLNHLIANHSVLLAGTRVAHWFRNRVAAEEDPMDLIMSPGDEDDQALNAQIRARKLVEGIRHGERPDLANNTYYALTISSNGGRVVVRDWMEGRFEDLAANVDQWFSDLEIVRRDGDGMAKPPKLAGVLAALSRELKDVPAPVAAKIYRVAAYGEPIPFATMAQALGRVRVDAMQGEQSNHARMGLIKAFHLRKWRQQGADMEQTLKPELYPDFDCAAYQCGRLMAVLGKLQTAALGDVGAGVVQRYYAAASTTPALVFGRLVRGAQPHIAKLGDKKRGLAIWYERQISQICRQIGQSMPSTLNLEDQSLFALGYYQELAALWAGKEQTPEGEQTI